MARRTLPSRLELKRPAGSFKRRTLRKRQLDDALVRLSRADDAAVRADGSSHPFPLFDDLWIGLVDDRAHPREHLAAPVAELLDALVDL